MSPLIQNPDSGRKLQRGFRLTSLPDSLLAPEIVGVVLLEDWSEPLGDIVRGCRGNDAVGGVAAEIPGISLVRVGLGRAYELVVTRLWFSSLTTQRIHVIQATNLSGQSASGNTSFTDFGIPGRPTSQLGVFNQAALPAGRRLFGNQVLADTVVQLEVNWKMGTFEDGGLTALTICGGTVNTTLQAGFEWSEGPPLG